VYEDSWKWRTPRPRWTLLESVTVDKPFDHSFDFFSFVPKLSVGFSSPRVLVADKNEQMPYRRFFGVKPSLFDSTQIHGAKLPPP
jgi:hypothetical protein